MKLLLIGFGTVGQGLAELLIEKKLELKRDHGLDCTVVGISDMLKGSCYDPDGHRPRGRPRQGRGRRGPVDAAGRLRLGRARR